MREVRPWGHLLIVYKDEIAVVGEVGVIHEGNGGHLKYLNFIIFPQFCQN